MMAAVKDDAVALERAIQLACSAHWGQVYPSPEGEPFILHPLRVMLAMRGTGRQMAAVLHDVLEDTPMTVDELRAEGLPGAVIAAIIVLTRRDGTSYEDYIERVALNPIARAVKAADIADNLANNRRLPATPEVAGRIARYERALLRLGS
jgi:guanosine-3',5'-bis(diphosphate) 3'-pyrophosphohydrolase